jgi:hypothetical protein
VRSENTPEVAPDGTVTTSSVSEAETITAVLPLNLTDLVVERFVPVIVTEEPTTPELAERLAILGVSETVGTLIG